MSGANLEAVAVRAYRPSDADALASVFQRAVDEIGRRDYTPDQLRVWASQGPTAERLQALSEDGRVRLVAVDPQDAPLAFADLEPDGHIDLLYCAPEAAGMGVTPALYNRLEEEARRLGVTRLYSEASEAARRFFLKRGFVVIKRRNLNIAGVDIHNFAVEKPL